ncbi:MAG: c-type cytochrome biogenesis protein CcmI [Moraxellaceae bacterium]|nr:c-type cytochrome biogenesis protein CcmI [Moraxellaceae bacterium]
MTNPLSLAFIVSAALLSLIVAWLFVWPLSRGERASNASLLQLNIQVFKERLEELEQDYRQVKIDQETFNALKIELERQLLSLANNNEQNLDAAKSVFKRSGLWMLFIFIPLLATLAYVSLAYQSDLWRWWQVQAKLSR